MRTETSNTIERLIQSLKNRGLARTIESGLSVLEDIIFDLRYRTDTVRRVSLDDLTVVGKTKDEANPYHPTRGRVFRKVMSQLSFPPDSVFVDFGSGKGKMLMLASRLGFKRVVGVEFSPELCAIAEKNIKTWFKAYGQSEIQVVCCDAGDYPVQGNENIFFMFNPFGAAVMQLVIGNITSSLNRHPRKVWMVYGDPSERAVIEELKGVREILSYSYGGFDFSVWVMGETPAYRND